MQNIRWMDDIGMAERAVSASGKLLLLFFHAEKCSGCKKTIEETLANLEVTEAIENYFVPMKVLVPNSRDLVDRYSIDWTPTFIVADENGKELERWQGYLPVEDFIAQLYISDGLAHFHREKYHDAEEMFETILKEHPKTDVAPEARYYLGVASFKELGNQNTLRETWKYLMEHYPENSWTKRASVWA